MDGHRFSQTPTARFEVPLPFDKTLRWYAELVGFEGMPKHNTAKMQISGRGQDLQVAHYSDDSRTPANDPTADRSVRVATLHKIAPGWTVTIILTRAKDEENTRVTMIREYDGMAKAE